jgi:hypothetical protein
VGSLESSRMIELIKQIDIREMFNLKGQDITLQSVGVGNNRAHLLLTEIDTVIDGAGPITFKYHCCFVGGTTESVDLIARSIVEADPTIKYQKP